MAGVSGAAPPTVTLVLGKVTTTTSREVFSPLLSTRMEVFISASVEGTGVCVCVYQKMGYCGACVGSGVCINNVHINIVIDC